MPRATSSPTRGKCQPHTCSKKQRARGHTAFRSGFPRAVADLETTNAAFAGRRKPCPVKAVCFYIKHEQNSNYAFRCVGNGFHQRSGNKALDSLKRHFTRRHKNCLCLSWRHIRRIVKWRRGKTDYEQSGIRHIARVVQGREIHSLFLRPSRRIRCISHLLQRRNSQTSPPPIRQAKWWKPFFPTDEYSIAHIICLLRRTVSFPVSSHRCIPWTLRHRAPRNSPNCSCQIYR